jgi:nicotinamide-nucleotide amidase
MNAEIISIGTELLLGEINDTNATYIAQQLKNIGLNLYYRSTVGDNEQRITEVIRLAMHRADIIITTGGLGPTVDDMTRQGVANAVGQPLEFRQELMDQITDRFARFNTKMTDNNRFQAFLPKDALAIENPVGTAPSFIVETDRGAIISLPGVPREMKYLMEHAVLPYLRERAGTGIIKLRILRTAGAGESWLGEQITDLMKLDNPTVGTAAHSGQTDIRITAKATTEAEADTLIAPVEAEVRKRIGSFIYGTDKEPVENALLGILREMHGFVAISETGTFGALRKRLQGQADGAEFIAATDQYENLAELRSVLGADAAIDVQGLAERGAKVVFENSGASLAIGIVSDHAGTAICVTDGVTVRSRAYAYGGIDLGGAEWATGWGISMAWRLLREKLQTPE